MDPIGPSNSSDPSTPTSVTTRLAFSDDLKFKQYKLFVESAERVSDRRASINRFYVAIHTSLLTLLTIVGGYGLYTSASGQPIVPIGFLAQAQAPILILLSILGLALCVVWLNHISSFRRLNQAKFKVILPMEEQMPFQCFSREWDIVKAETKSFFKRKYIELTDVERFLPVLSILLYLAFLVTYIVTTYRVPLSRLLG